MLCFLMSKLTIIAKIWWHCIADKIKNEKMITDIVHRAAHHWNAELFLSPPSPVSVACKDAAVVLGMCSVFAVMHFCIFSNSKLWVCFCCWCSFVLHFACVLKMTCFAQATISSLAHFFGWSMTWCHSCDFSSSWWMQMPLFHLTSMLTFHLFSTSDGICVWCCLSENMISVAELASRDWTLQMFFLHEIIKLHNFFVFSIVVVFVVFVIVLVASSVPAVHVAVIHVARNEMSCDAMFAVSTVPLTPPPPLASLNHNSSTG